MNEILNKPVNEQLAHIQGAFGYNYKFFSEAITKPGVPMHIKFLYYGKIPIAGYMSSCPGCATVKFIQEEKAVIVEITMNGYSLEEFKSYFGQQGLLKEDNPIVNYERIITLYFDNGHVGEGITIDPVTKIAITSPNVLAIGITAVGRLDMSDAFVKAEEVKV